MHLWFHWSPRQQVEERDGWLSGWRVWHEDLSLHGDNDGALKPAQTHVLIFPNRGKWGKQISATDSALREPEYMIACV